MSLRFTFLLIVGISVTANSILLEVPGYTTIEGSTDTSYHTKRQYFKFRGLYYAEKPTNQNRFLVSSKEMKILKILN